MQHKTLEKKSGELKVEVTVDADKIKKITNLVVSELSKTIKTPGFRPGKAPQLVVEREVGKDRFWAEVLDKLIPEAYYETLIKEKISPISQPKVEVRSFVPGESLVFEFSVAVMPEIKNLKYKALKIKEKKAAVTKDEINESLASLAKKMTDRKSVKREARDGDQVEIDFEGTLKGLPFDGGKSQNHPIILGSGTMVPGFEEKIVGHKAGEEFDISITFPKEYHAKNLADQKVDFKINLKEVFELIVPKIEDDLAKKFGAKDLEALKEEVSRELQFQKELEVKRELEEAIITKIIEVNSIDAPEALVSEQVHNMIHEAEHNLSHSGLTMEKFLETSNKTIADLEKEMHPEAVRRVKIGLVLGEVARLEKIEVTEADVVVEIEKIVSTASADIQKDDLRASYEAPEKKKEIQNSMVIRRTLDKLIEYNKI